MTYFTLLLIIMSTNAAINLRGPTIISDYTNCITQLIEFEFIKSGLLVFAYSDNVNTSVSRLRNELLYIINKKMKYSVRVTSPGKETPICSENEQSVTTFNNLDLTRVIPKADYYLIIVDKLIDLYSVANKLISSRSWNPQAKFIILWFHFASNDELNVQHVEHLFTCLFRYNVLNISFVVPQANKRRRSMIYGWQPYNPPKYCGYSNETARNRLKIENMCEKGVLKYNKSVFQNKIPSDMQGCTLFVIALERQPFVSANDKDPNLEKYFVGEIFKKHNFSWQIEILNAFRGERESQQWSGALRELILKRGNVLLGGIHPDYDVNEDFECSSTYFEDSYTWVVPRSYPSPRWIALTIIFTRFVWCSVFLAFIICVVAWKFIGILNNDSVYNKSLSHSFLNTWICTFGFTTYTQPKKNGLRVFYAFLNMYCMMCITAYQTKLIDVLRNPTFKYQIKTVEELINSGLKFGGSEELHDIFYNSTDPFDNHIGEKWIDIENITEAMLNVAVYRNFSLLCSRFELIQISALMPELSDGFGNYKFYSFKENVFSVPLQITALKGFPFIREFSNTLRKFKLGGVSSGLRRQFTAYIHRKRAKILRLLGVKPKTIVSLSIEHLQGGFLALLIGFIMGSFILVVEILTVSKVLKNRFIKIWSVMKNKINKRGFKK